MPDASNILADSPAQITIYDSTNNNLYLGYLSSENIQLTQKPLYHKIVSGGWRQYGVRTILKCQLLETDPSKIANLKNRRTLKQTIYIVAGNYGVKLSNCYITHAQNREFEFDGNTVIKFEAHTDIENDVEVLKNLMGSEGSFENETSGLGDGWTNVGMSSVSVNDPSFLNGAGNNDQQCVADNPTDYIYYRVTFPFEQKPVRVTVSVHAQSVTTSEDFNLIIRTLNESDVQITLNESTNFTATTSSTDRVSYSVNVNDLGVNKIEVRLKSDSTGTLKYDDAQLEFGPLSDYTEND